MRICSGASRRVLLVGNVAIKIARVNLLRVFKHVWWALFQKDTAQEKYEKYRASTPQQAVGNYLRNLALHGFQANRQEFRLSRDYPELPLARVFGMYLGGFVLVMERGEPAPPHMTYELRQRHWGGDLNVPRHVCLFQGNPKFIDFGTPDALPFLGVQ